MYTPWEGEYSQGWHCTAAVTATVLSKGALSSVNQVEQGRQSWPLDTIVFAGWLSTVGSGKTSGKRKTIFGPVVRVLRVRLAGKKGERNLAISQDQGTTGNSGVLS